MKDADRWVNLDGEPPGWIRELLEAGRDVPDLTPEEAKAMESSFLKALAVQRRRQAQERQAATAGSAMPAPGMGAPPMPPPEPVPVASAQPGTQPAPDLPEAAPSSDPSGRSSPPVKRR